MKAEYINPFVTAAAEVLNAEAHGNARRNGDLRLDHGSETSHDITAMVGLTGDVRGLVLLGMATTTACRVYGAMMGEEATEFDEMGRSALGELCNMISGHAATKLAEAGRQLSLTPPSIITGKGASLSTLAVPRLVIPLTTTHGDVRIDIAISET